MKKILVAGFIAVLSIEVSLAASLVVDSVITTNAIATNVLAGAVSEGSSLNLASGVFSHSEGFSTVASGAAAHAEGSGTISAGNYAHAEGAGTVAAGYASHAAGTFALATNDYTYVWSDGTEIGSTTTRQYTVYAENGIRLLGGPIEGDGAGLSNLSVNVSEADPVWSADKADYLTEVQLNSRYLRQSGGFVSGTVIFSDLCVRKINGFEIQELWPSERSGCLYSGVSGI